MYFCFPAYQLTNLNYLRESRYKVFWLLLPQTLRAFRHHTPTMILPEDRIVIVGAGCFGVSAAYHLLKRGFTDVTIIERSEILPAKDAASNDINRSLYCHFIVQSCTLIQGKISRSILLF